jgi:hypothetical protein
VLCPLASSLEAIFAVFLPAEFFKTLPSWFAMIANITNGTLIAIAVVGYPWLLECLVDPALSNH